MQKYLRLFLLIFYPIISFSQENQLSNIKYIIVSNKFDFVKTIDEYQTSSLTKFLFNQKGFQTFLSDENFPEDLNLNSDCNALNADVKEDSNLFTTKIVVELKDCRGKNVFTSETGKSKLKDYKKAYHEAIRDAFNTMTDFTYNYQPNSKSFISSELKKNHTDEIILNPIEVKKEEITTTPTDEVLYAQPTKNGFQLVNSTPKVVYVLLKTSDKDIFLIKGTTGIVHKVEENWFIEFYENDTLMRNKILLKF